LLATTALAQGPAQPPFAQPDAQHLIRLPDGVDAKARPARMTLPQVLAYNITVEQQLTKKVSVSGAYIGNQGRHQLLASGPSFDVNNPAYIPGDPNVNDGRITGLASQHTMRLLQFSGRIDF